MSKTLAKSFKQLSKKDINIAGGKGSSLGELTQAGILVPDGFVILSNVFNDFLKEANLNVKINAILNKVDINKMHTIEDASEKIKDAILLKEIPKNFGIFLLWT